MHKIHLLIILLAFQSLFAFSEKTFVINSGHSRQVQSFSQQDNNILYSCDARGTLMKWDTKTKSLIEKLQISYLTIKSITVNSTGTKLAVVETDNISSFRLSVWDLKNKVKLFSHKMEGLPLFIKFSPSSKYIIYSKTDWNGLIFLDSNRGSEIPLIFEDYGIVSSVYITSSEKTLMFYSPSGNIQYWNLTNGKLKAKPIITRKNLSSINMTEDGTLMTAFDSEHLYLISLQNGSTLFTEKISNVQYTKIDKLNNRLIVLYKENNNYKIGTWLISRINNRNTLLKQKDIEISANITPSAGFEILNNSLYFSGLLGEIFKIDINTNNIIVFSKNIISSIYDVNFFNGELLLATKNNIIALKSNIFSNQSTLSSKADITLVKYLNPFNDPTGIVSNNNNFYIYPLDNQQGIIKIFNNYNFFTVSNNFSSPILSVKLINGNFITLEKDGTCRIINSTNGTNIFKYSSFGINSLVSVFGNNLIAGRNRTAYLKSPLLHINPITEEVVPIQESNIIIFKVDYDNITRTLYTLGFEERKTGLITVLKSHAGKNWELTDTIMTYPGEDQSGTFVVDELKSRIYLSIGNSGIIMYGWGGFTEMEKNNHLPKKLFIHGDFLISLNIDSSITVWNTNNGKVILNYFLLKDNKWIAENSENKIIVSDNSLYSLIN